MDAILGQLNPHPILTICLPKNHLTSFHIAFLVYQWMFSPPKSVCIPSLPQLCYMPSSSYRYALRFHHYTRPFDSKPYFPSETNNIALGSHTNKQFLKYTPIKHSENGVVSFLGHLIGNYPLSTSKIKKMVNIQ